MGQLMKKRLLLYVILFVLHGILIYWLMKEGYRLFADMGGSIPIESGTFLYYLEFVPSWIIKIFAPGILDNLNSVFYFHFFVGGIYWCLIFFVVQKLLASLYKQRSSCNNPPPK